ncbi:uncharacterized protein MYCFIDRAFT_82185 [Pseudocercospora fijiensis CIRAD86]|uniref:C2H2-type domain-containing protein n=1 Tax=Pseudocercospora fijiensis (strain CIRAD86) TaxID=383855 RepID=M2Z916_PSEFD|nr:uncharacterized protein MYCFIDRAFT_82185 [Pseudocercospora fijiensis CIRAD86]EME86260.1 hypothetical protein MYCFIDRAFT_82185 [Pseudocercospora fijiensis CIRAD86]
MSNASTLVAPRISIHSTEGHSDVSRPPMVPRKLTLSEIFDPDEIAADGHVRSPSGNFLDAKQFREHPKRPLCMRERQERILQRTQKQRELGMASPTQIAPFAFEKDHFDFGNTTTVQAQSREAIMSSDSDSETTTTLTSEQRKASQGKPVPCSYADCQHRFDTVEDMIHHKIREPSHFYCKKCKVDCADWEGLLAHQVDMMAPFLGEKKRDSGERPTHIVCELCGITFKSMGGRRDHRRQAHPADQDVECPGCSCKFPRASHLIDHLEQGRCSRFTKDQFYSHMQHKYILSQVMKNPGIFSELVMQNQKQLLPPMEQLSIKSDAEAEDPDEGGVSILEEYDEAQQSGYKPLEPERSLMDFHDHASVKAWPKLSSRATSRAGAPSATSSAWTSGRLSKAPQKVETSSQPAAGKWDAITKFHREQSKNTNLLNTHFWNDEQYFWNEFLQCYVCPLPACQSQTALSNTFTTLDEIKQHIELAHLRSFYRCEGCYKRFNTCAALVGHVEATQKCGIRQSDKFKKFINEVTGGFLVAERVAESKIYGRDMSVVKLGEKPLNGVTSTKYTSKSPYE